MLQDGITCPNDIVITQIFRNTLHVSNLLHCPVRSIVNQSATMTGNTTYDMAVHNVKIRTTNVLRGVNQYGVLEDSDDEECMNKEV